MDALSKSMHSSAMTARLPDPHSPMTPAGQSLAAAPGCPLLDLRLADCMAVMREMPDNAYDLANNFPDPAESTRVLVFCLLRESMMGSGNLSAADAIAAISKELNRQIPAFEKQDTAAINAAIFPDP